MRQLCRGDAATACGVCRSCQLVQAGTHPDHLLLQPHEPEAPIKVDAVRKVVAFLGQKAQFSGWRVVLIDPAERMNVQAANALLKTLEEPGEQVLLLLVSERPGELLATLRSRCQLWPLPRASFAQAEAWLAALGAGAQAQPSLRLARSAPLRAQMLAETAWPQRLATIVSDLQSLLDGHREVLNVAAQWKSWGEPLILADILAQWVEDLMSRHVRRTTGLHHPEFSMAYDRMLSGLDAAKLHGVWQKLITLTRDLAGNVQLQLWLETLALDIARLSRRGGSR